ncbi:hypothetical protein DJ93_531 [Bacillus clarus]|uniref:SmpA / OmlA family protein n=1 Tax=Bacillus clarus TaxID=2338372 RepID=A0A090ZAF7_9BACI|nr:hypothetical protein DJ93_531 [Bacillus clarus]
MKYKNMLLWGILYSYICLYFLVYLSFIFIIDISHLSYSIISVLAVLVPFILLLVIQRMILFFSIESIKAQYKKKFVRITIVGLLTLLFCTVQLGINEYTSKFHPDKWLGYETDRVYMVDDLLKKHKLVGKSKEEIIQLLGYPTETRNFEKVTHTLYYLGNERGFIPIDSEWLAFQFDNEDRVVDYKLQKD